MATADAIRHLVVEKTAPPAILADFQSQGAQIHFA
jgi:hypothetical protein